MLGGFERLREHNRDRLALVPDLVVLQWNPYRGCRGHRWGAELRHLLVREDVRDARDLKRSGAVNGAEPPGRGGGAEHDAVEHLLGEVVGGVTCRARDLRRTVLTRQ